MPSETYYVFDNKLCKAEGMTKEEIYNAIAEATGTTPSGSDEGFISTIVEVNKNKSIQIWSGTMAEYNELQTHDENTLYFIDGDATIDDIEAQITNTDTTLAEVMNSLDAAEQDIDTAEQNISDLQEAVDTSVDNFEIVTVKENGTYTTQTSLENGLYLARVYFLFEKGGTYEDQKAYVMIYVDDKAAGVSANSGISANFHIAGTDARIFFYDEGGQNQKKLRLESGTTLNDFTISVMKLGLGGS